MKSFSFEFNDVYQVADDIIELEEFAERKFRQGFIISRFNNHPHLDLTTYLFYFDL